MAKSGTRPVNGPSTTGKPSGKGRANKYLLIGVILFAIFSLSVIFLVKREDGDKAFLCIVLGMLAFTIIPLILAKKVSKAKEKKLFNLEKFTAVYIAEKYHNISNDSLFLSKLYDTIMIWL